MQVENYPNCIDLLGNASPVYLLFAGSGSGFENGILTAPEPAGTGEKAVLIKKASA